MARDLRSAWDDLRILPALTATVGKYRAEREIFRTLVVIFEQPDDLTEVAFERHLWARAQSLSDKDAWVGNLPDPSVSSDPEDPHFSLSFAGEAFFVVGLHPHASRPARRFERPAMVFNLHDQFEVLREQQRYEKLRTSSWIGTSRWPVRPTRCWHGTARRARRGNIRVGPWMPIGAALSTVRASMLEDVIPPRSGTAFTMRAGERLSVIDIEGVQVADLLAFNAGDIDEALSSGRTLDYAETIRLTAGHLLYSNRSRPMLAIEADTVGVHDFLLTPCSVDTFRHFYPDEPEHRGCFGNLAAALAPYGIGPDRIPTAFNCFMNVPVGADGRITVAPPVSKAGDHIVFRAEMDLIVGLTACSAYASNGGSFKPIGWRLDAG